MTHSASLRATGSEIDASTWVARSGSCRRISSMTFFSASRSLWEVEDVAATAAGTTGLRGRNACTATRSRAADGAIDIGAERLAVTFGASAGIEAVARAKTLMALGWRTTGRGLGRGTL